MTLGSAPSTDQEKLHLEHPQTTALLTELIESVFGIAPRNEGESIFELESCSPAALKLFQEEFQKRFDRNLTLATLFQAPTIAALSAFLWQSPPNESSRFIVPLQVAGERPPFFCVHGAGGNIMPFRRLSSLLGPNQPFYGLQSPQLAENPVQETTVEDLASDYVEGIRTVQPRGPYYLGGYSFGGTVAFEMAQQLLNAGEEVATVVLIDTLFPGGRFPLTGDLNPRLIHRLDYGVGKFFALGRGKRINWLKGLLLRKASAALKRKRSVDETSPSARNIAAHLAYEPTVLDARMVLLWASDCAFRAFQDSRLGWCDLAGRGLEVRRVSGTHLDMLKPPYVDVLARELAGCLRD